MVFRVIRFLISMDLMTLKGEITLIPPRGTLFWPPAIKIEVSQEVGIWIR